MKARDGRRRVVLVAFGLAVLVASAVVAFRCTRSSVTPVLPPEGHLLVGVGWTGDVDCLASCEIVPSDAGAVTDGTRRTDPLFGCLFSGRFHAKAVGLSTIRCENGRTVEVDDRAPSTIDIEFPSELAVGETAIPKVHALDEARTVLPLGTAGYFATFSASGALERAPTDHMDFITRGERFVAAREGDGQREATFEGMSISKRVLVRPPRDSGTTAP